MSELIASTIRFWSQSADWYNLYIAPFWPTILQLLVLFTTLYGIRHRWIPQISDIFNPNSAAEIHRAQFPFYTVNVTWDRGPRFEWTRIRMTWNYVFNVGVVLVIWLFVLYTQYLINKTQMQHYHRALLANDRANMNYAITSEERPPLIRFLDGDGPLSLRYFRVTLWTEAAMCLPLLFSIVTIRFNERRFHNTPDRIDRHGMALVGTFCLLGLINMAITEWRLGVNSGVGWLETFLPFVPLLYIALILFSPYRWTENGKGLLNTRGEDGPASDQLPPPVPTLDFLEHPPAARKSLSEDADHTHLPRRQQNHEGPLVILCASGGGARAALFAAGILSRMWWQVAEPEASLKETLAQLSPDDQRRLSDTGAPSPSTTRDSQPVPVSAITGQKPAAVYPGRLLLQYADAISSVSGGSLAMGYFVESLHRDIRDRQQGKLDARAGRYQALQRFFDPAGLDSEETRPPIRWYNERTEPLSLREFFNAPITGGFHSSIAENEVQQKAVESNPYINAMQQDHLAATMCGFFRPFRVGRGPGIEAFWEQAYQWVKSASTEEATPPRSPVCLSDFFHQELGGYLPALILNATITRTGTRLAITNLDATEFQETYKFGPIVDGRDLGEGDLVAAGVARGRVDKDGETTQKEEEKVAEAAQRRYDPLPAQINTLNELDPRWDIPLKTATHASANFPFGFPLMRFVRRKPDSTITDPKESEVQFQGGRDILEICDGGLIDNTGLDSALALIRANRDDLKQRGVLIFQIDSGELPRNPGKFLRDTLHHLTEAKNAMWRASLNLQSELQSEYIEELQKIFDDDVVPIMGRAEDTQDYVLGFENDKFAFYRVRLGETNDEHVMTSWHLDAPQRALLYDEVRAPQQGEAILRAAQWLARRATLPTGSASSPTESLSKRSSA